MNESDRSEITKLRSENRRLKAQLEGKNDASKDDSILLQSSEVEELRKSVEEKEREIEEERKSLEREREKTGTGIDKNWLYLCMFQKCKKMKTMKVIKNVDFVYHVILKKN